MAVRLVEDDEHLPTEAAEQTVRVEHVSLFPTKEAVAVFTALSYVLGAHLIFAGACIGAGVLTYLNLPWQQLLLYNVFVVVPSALLAYAKKGKI